LLVSPGVRESVLKFESHIAGCHDNNVGVCKTAVRFIVIANVCCLIVYKSLYHYPFDFEFNSEITQQLSEHLENDLISQRFLRLSLQNNVRIILPEVFPFYFGMFANRNIILMPFLLSSSTCSEMFRSQIHFDARHESSSENMLLWFLTEDIVTKVLKS